MGPVRARLALLGRGWRGDLLVLAAAAAVYAGTLGHALVWDDVLLREYVAETVRDAGLRGLLLAEFALRVGESTGYYRPLVLLSLWLDFSAGSLAPLLGHLTNAALHALCSVLVLRLLRQFLPPGGGALAGALLFAVHPVHVESVAFVSGRTDLLAAVFVLLAVLHWRARRGAPTPLALGASAGLFVLALLSKEVAAAMPAAALAWGLLPGAEEDRGLRDRARRLLPWAAAWGLALCLVAVLRFAVLGRWFGAAPGMALGAAGGVPLDPLERTAGVVLLSLRLLAVPWPLNPAYTGPAVLPSWENALGAAAVAGACAVVWRRPCWAGARGAAWIAAFLLPVSGLFPVAGAPAAERFLYLPSVGFALAAGAVVVRFRVASPQVRRAAAGLGLTVLTLFAAGTVVQSRVWRDEPTLYAETVRRSPAAPLAHVNLGNVYARDGDLPRAVESYRAALSLNDGLALAWAALAEAHARAGAPGEAEAALRRALRAGGPNAVVYNDLARVQASVGRYPEALDSLGRALALAPNKPDYHNNLGVVYWALEQPDRAAAAYRKALELRPAYPEALYNLALCRADRGYHQEAAELLERALRADPDYTPAREELRLLRSRPGGAAPAPGAGR